MHFSTEPNPVFYNNTGGFIITWFAMIFPNCLIFILVLTLTHFGVCIDSDVQFGGCQPENLTCSECYYKLKEILLKSDTNVRALSTTFFPPKDNLPEFVVVTYCFDDICNRTRTWYWTHDSSYLFFPPQTFQYLSLFFGKPATFITKNVTLMLDEECYEAHIDMFNLLTQRVS